MLIRNYCWYKQISPKYETAKNSCEFSYTTSNKWTYVLSMLSESIIFFEDYIRRLLLKERICSQIGSILFPLKVAPMRIETDLT